MSLNLFLVVVFFEPLLLVPPLAKRNLDELLVADALVAIALLLFVLLPLLLPEDANDVCTKLECVFFLFKEEEKEVLATAAAAEQLSMIKLLAVRMNDMISSSFSFSRAC